LSFFISNPFILLVFVGVLLVHAVMWLITDAAVDAQTFYVNGFAHGCRLTFSTAITVLIIIQCVVYVGAGALAFMMLLAFRVRDTLRIRLEMFLIVLFYSVLLLPYVISMLVPVINTVVDYIVPYFLFVQAAMFFDNLVSIVLPCTASIVMERRQKRQKRTSTLEGQESRINDDELQFTLRSAPLLELFKHYSARSFAVESVLAWVEIQRYRSL
jgi:uncharacterized membrane protein